MRRFLALAALLAATVGCSGPDGGDVPTAASRPAVPRGRALGGGFVVEPGSTLLGGAFPEVIGGFLQGAGYDEGRRAILRIEGDPQTVFEGSVRQAAAAGVPVTGGERCFDGDVRRPLACRATGGGVGPDFAMVRLYVLEDGDAYVVVHFRGQGAARELPPVPKGAVAKATGPEIAPALTPGGPFEAPVRVVDGSRLLGDPVPATCETGGYEAVLEVAGDPLPVMRGYAAQFAEAWKTAGGDVRADDRYAITRFVSAGGGGLDAVAVLGEPTYVLIHRCND